MSRTTGTATKSSAQALLANKGSPSGMEAFLAGFVVNAGISSHLEEGTLTMHLKLLNKSSDTTKQKSLREILSLIQDMETENIIPFVPVIVRAVINHSHHPNPSVRFGVYCVLRALMEKGKEVKHKIVPDLASLSGPWLMAMHDIDGKVRDEACVAFNTAFLPEKRSLMLLKYKDDILRYAFRHIENIIDNVSSLQQKEKESIPNTLHSALLTLGYLIGQVSASQAAVMSFLETPVLQKLIPLKAKQSESEKILFLNFSVRDAFLVLLREVVTVCPSNPTIHSLVARTLDSSISDVNAYIAKRVWELLLCWCRAVGAATILPYFPRKFLDTIIDSMMKCEKEDLAEVLFPSICPLLAQLSKDPACIGVLDEFCGALIEKIHINMRNLSISPKVISIVCKALISCWELHSIRRNSNSSNESIELFTVIISKFSDLLLLAETRQHEWFLKEICRALAVSLLKTLFRSEEFFKDCMRVLCAAKDAPFVVFSAPSEGNDSASTFPFRGYHHLQNSTLGFMCLEMVSDNTYRRWVSKLEEYFAENIRVRVEETKDFSQVAMTIRCADPTIFVPSKATVQLLARYLTATFYEWWGTPRILDVEDVKIACIEIPSDEVNVNSSKYILEAVLRWKVHLSEKELENLVRVANAPQANVIVQQSVEEYLIKDGEELINMLCVACRTSHFENLNRYLSYSGMNADSLQINATSLERILEAVGEALKSDVKSLEKGSQISDQVQGGDNEMSNGTEERSGDSSTTSSEDADKLGEERQRDATSKCENKDAGVSEHHASSPITSKSIIVSHHLFKWMISLHPQKGVLGELFAKESVTRNRFFCVIGEKMLILLSIIAPCLYPEYYLSMEALRLALQDTDDELVDAIEEKVHFVTTKQFNELCIEIKDLFTAYDVDTGVMDKWYEILWNRLLDDDNESENDSKTDVEEDEEDGKKAPLPQSLLAVQQIQQLLPLASPKMLLAIATSQEVWEMFMVDGELTVSMAPLFDGHYQLHQMCFSLYSAVRLGQLIRLADFCESHHYFSSGDPKSVGKPYQGEKQQVNRVYLLLQSAMAIRLFSTTTCVQLHKLLKTMMLGLGGEGNTPAHLAMLITQAEVEIRDKLICTLASVFLTMAKNLESSEKQKFASLVQRIVGHITEFIIHETISKSGPCGIKPDQVCYYSLFFQILDNIADVLHMNILSNISADLLVLFKEACCSLPAFDHLTVKLCLIVHRHLEAKLEIDEATAKGLIVYAQRQRIMDGLEVLAELSCCRVLQPGIFGELVRSVLHSMRRVYALKHLPTNGRLIQVSSPQEASKVDFECLWRSVMASITARKGVVLHSRLDSALRGTVNLIIYDVVCECVSHLRDAKKLEEPQLTRLVASTAVFLSSLQAEDVSVLRASESSTHTIASMFVFSYLWLCATPLMKLEAIGMDIVAGVLRAACLLGNLTLVKSGIPLTSQLEPVICKLPTKPLRQKFSSADVLKVKVYRRNNTLLRRSRKHSLALFPFLLGWGAFLSNTDPSPKRAEKIQRTSICTLLDIIVTLMLSPRLPGSSSLEDTFLCASNNSLDEEKVQNNIHLFFSIQSAHEDGSLSSNIGSALYPLTCTDSCDVMSALAKGSEALFGLLLHSPTLTFVKDWVDTVDKKLHGLIFEFVRRRISPLMVKEALKRVLSHSSDGKPRFMLADHMSVEVSMANSDVSLTYKVEEEQLTVRITFPPEYPLLPPQLEYRSGERECGVSVKKWRAWMMRMTAKLFEGGLNIWDCIVLFQRNVDAHFSGLEPCPICFAVICPMDAKIPELQCNSCNNVAKFHGACLYSWWSSGGSMVCPLCRAPWIS